jgi:hypothetical protein
MKTSHLVAACALCASAMASSTALAAYSLSPSQTFTTSSWADAVAVGDVNGDGRDDVVLTTTYYFDATNDYKVFVFFQKSDGTLDLPKKYSYPMANNTGLAMADLDHDGRSDIIVGHGAGISILRWAPVKGVMGMRSTLYMGGADMSGQDNGDVAVLDVDRDGALDVVGQSWSSGATIYFGDGHGNIVRQVALATPVSGYNDLKAGDFNGDGYQDIVVLSGQGLTHAYVYFNDGSDDFSAPLEINPNPDQSVTIGALGSGDFNADGRTDLVIMRDRTNLSLYLQNMSGVLQPPLIVPSDMDPNAMIGHDLDLDGRDDLIVQHGSGPLGIYLQGLSGLNPEIVTSNPYGTWFNTQGLAVGDVNGDACPDIVTANYNYGLVINAGNGCNAVADLAPSLGLTTSVVALRMDNFGAASAGAPDAVVDLALLSGNLSIGTLPAECAEQSQTATSARIHCTGAALDAGTSRTLLLPIGITGGDTRNALTANARVSTTSVELRTGNNTAHAVLRGLSLAATSIRASRHRGATAAVRP